MLIYNGPLALSWPYRAPISFCMVASLSNRKPEDLQNIVVVGLLCGGYLALVDPFLITRSLWCPMFLFSIPSDLLTLDVTLEEADSAPMEDGTLPMLPLNVGRPPARPDLRRDGLPLSLQRFPGYKALAFCWVPYELYDAATLPFGRVFAWRSDCAYIPACALYLTDTIVPFSWDTIYPYAVDMPA